MSEYFQVNCLIMTKTQVRSSQHKFCLCVSVVRERPHVIASSHVIGSYVFLSAEDIVYTQEVIYPNN